MSTRYVSIDEMLVFVGEFKLFQWILDAIFCIMMLPQTFQVLIMYFAALSPDWKCVTNSTICTLNGTFGSDNEARCNMPRNAWEFTQLDDYSIVTQFDIYCDKEWQIHLTTSIVFISWMFGAVVMGWLADNYGRKSVIFPSILIVIAAGFVSSFSPSIYWFLLFRFVVGFAIPGTSIQEFILINEIVGGKYRPRAGIILWIVFTIALCLLGLKAYLVRQWKLLYIICTAPYIFVIAFYKFVPESVRWLRLQGQTGEMMRIFERIAWWNNKNIPGDVQVSTGSAQAVHHKSNPLDLFKNRRITSNTLSQGYSWMVIGMVYYGLSLAADDLGGSLYLNYILVSVVEFPANAAAVYLCEVIGRKKTTIIPLLIGSICCILIAFIPNEGAAKVGRIILGMFGKFFITIAFSAIYTWSVEIFPTNLRAEGMGFLQITSRIGAASSPWIAKGLKVLYKSLPFVVMGCTTLIASGLLFILPETKGVATAETENDFRVNVQGLELEPVVEEDSKACNS